MLFMQIYKPKAGFTHEDQKKALKLWENWSPPEGMEIKSFYTSPDGRGFLLIESSSAEAAFEGMALWAGVYLDYEFVPVVEIEKAVPLLNKAISSRESA